MARTRVLLVQCCHIPQWIHVWRRLSERHPDWEVDSLALDHPQVRFYAERLAPGGAVRYLSEDLSSSRYDLIVFPLLNRGYRKIKRIAWRLGGDRRETDYTGTLRPLSRSGLLRSLVHPTHGPDAAFAAFLDSFPHRPLGEKVLFVESAGPGLIRGARDVVDKHVPAQAEITRIGGGSLLRLWRRLRGESFDGAVVFLTGEPGYSGLKALPFLLGVPRILAINEHGSHFYADLRSVAGFLFRRFLRGVDSSPRDPKILLIQTEAPEYVLACVEKLRRPGRFAEARILLVCRGEDRALFDAAAVEGIETFAKRRGPAELWRLWRRVRRFDPDINCAVFSGRPVFWKQKLFSLLVGSRRILAFNAKLDSYWLTPRTFRRVFRREPLLYGPKADPAPRVILFQTEVADYVREACRRLREPGRFPDARFLLVCRESDAERLRDAEGVEEILTFPPGRSLRDTWRLWRRVRRRKFDFRCALFTGRPIFRHAKLLFFASGLRRGLALNAGLDGYWLTPSTLFRVFRKEPLLFEPGRSEAVRVILLETEGPEIMKRALDTLRLPHVAPAARVTLFCREDRARHFLGEDILERIVVYKKQAVLNDLLQVWSLARSRPGIVAAVFSGRRVFTKQKLLFWLTPARSRLAFNENLDCFYVRWSNLGYLFHRGVRRSGSLPRHLLLTVAKALLLAPRFLFLLVWAAAAKGRRRRVLASEARRGQMSADSGQRTAGSNQRSEVSGQRAGVSGQEPADSGQRTAAGGQRAGIRQTKAVDGRNSTGGGQGS